MEPASILHSIFKSSFFCPHYYSPSLSFSTYIFFSFSSFIAIVRLLCVLLHSFVHSEKEVCERVPTRIVTIPSKGEISIFCQGIKESKTMNINDVHLLSRQLHDQNTGSYLTHSTVVFHLTNRISHVQRAASSQKILASFDFIIIIVSIIIIIYWVQRDRAEFSTIGLHGLYIIIIIKLYTHPRTHTISHIPLNTQLVFLYFFVESQ